MFLTAHSLKIYALASRLDRPPFYGVHVTDSEKATTLSSPIVNTATITHDAVEMARVTNNSNTTV
ncbi:hypothetical protein PAXRUDRAFT_834945 [Paxillus rubicundulus Ve08.2h10]|uniref:Uncharacterized protein n=1 Tax=Paxillus rubicundulus Ve08.2h10 TaxID=930991 RepID=A0A0D0D208_9AGAM|nr:hypothetical protein PAXRUDRAFT_834945 [Paxillus rubicundulus Ve08.2h10]